MLGSPVISASVSCCGVRCKRALNSTGVKITISHSRAVSHETTMAVTFHFMFSKLAHNFYYSCRYMKMRLLFVSSGTRSGMASCVFLSWKYPIIATVEAIDPER